MELMDSWSSALLDLSMAHLPAALKVLARKRDDFRDDELCDRARVGEGRVENGDTGFGCRVQVDLVRAYAEAANNQKLRCCGQVMSLTARASRHVPLLQL